MTITAAGALEGDLSYFFDAEARAHTQCRVTAKSSEAAVDEKRPGCL
ncbi:hypothetical protein BSU04_20210 [Caballeronia sordidicola]|uniref:Uncharacterized protein n=1 Tax=Caballeronia sordidicola TaxID=196367 RepID=A0A226X012_CABSO|nr:hypothetical protein BSU04_20210 [Caballeronia sordidicola]